MSTSGYYDEIAKVEALRRQRLWRLRKRKLDAASRGSGGDADQIESGTNGAGSASFRKRP